MTGWLARRALYLYPLAYRRRYGEEMRTLLEDRPPTVRAVLDLVRSALLAHLRPADGPAGAVDPPDRVRASASGVLMCWIFFAAAGFGFYKTTEDQPFSSAGHAHPVLRDAHMAVQIVALIASGVVILAALPLIVAALDRARREPGMRRLVWLPFVPVVLFGALTVGVIAYAHSRGPALGHPTTAGNGVAIVWGIAALIAGVSCVLACRAALFATPASPTRLRLALAGATVVTIAMLLIAATTALYAIALAADASALAAQGNGPFGLLSVTVSLILTTVVMVAAGLLATTATARGWRVGAEL